MAWQPTPQSFRDAFQVKNPRPDGYPTGWRGPMGGFGQPPGQNAFAPGQAQPQQSPWATSTPYGQQPAWDQQMPFGGQSFGIPSFQFRATDFMGNQFDNPSAFTAQQGAMAQALNQQRSQQISQGSFGSLNPALAYQQGQQMIQDGWQNPFAEPRDPAGNQVRELLVPAVAPASLAGARPYRTHGQAPRRWPPPAARGDGAGHSQPGVLATTA